MCSRRHCPMAGLLGTQAKAPHSFPRGCGSLCVTSMACRAGGGKKVKEPGFGSRSLSTGERPGSNRAAPCELAPLSLTLASLAGIPWVGVRRTGGSGRGIGTRVIRSFRRTVIFPHIFTYTGPCFGVVNTFSCHPTGLQYSSHASPCSCRVRAAPAKRFPFHMRPAPQPALPAAI